MLLKNILRNIIFTCTILLLIISCSCNARKSGLGFNTDKDELANNVPNYVLFDVDSAKLDPQARNVLDGQANWLGMNSDINILIEGHCDERGTREYNLALGAKRANSVKSYLTSSGITSSRIATISYGKERPVVQGTGKDVWRENRRAITLVN